MLSGKKKKTNGEENLMENREIIIQKEIKTVKTDLRDFFFTSLKSKKQNKTHKGKNEKHNHSSCPP